MYSGDDPEKRKQILNQITVHSAGLMRTMQKKKAFINNHPKKIEIAKKILEARENCKIITFSNNVKMAESLENGQNVYTGKTTKKKGRVMIEDFLSGRITTLHSCAKLNEGFDDPSLSVAIILGMNSSKTVKKQRLGRVLRHQEGKVVEIFNLVLKGTVGRRKCAVVPDGTGVFDCRVVPEDDVGGTYRVAIGNMDGTAIIRHAALDTAASYATRQRQVTAVVCPDHVTCSVVVAQVAIELVSIQVDGHGLPVDVEVSTEQDILGKLDVRGTIGDGVFQFLFRLDGGLCPKALCNRAQQGKCPDDFLFHIYQYKGLFYLTGAKIHIISEITKGLPELFHLTRIFCFLFNTNYHELITNFS